MLYGNAGIIDLHNLSVLNKSIVPHFDNINNLIYDILVQRIISNQPYDLPDFQTAASEKHNAAGCAVRQ